MWHYYLGLSDPNISLYVKSDSDICPCAALLLFYTYTLFACYDNGEGLSRVFVIGCAQMLQRFLAPEKLQPSRGLDLAS